MTEKLKIDWVEFIGSVSPQDIEDGTVLVFRISDNKYPKHIMDSLVNSIQTSVNDLFNGQVKAIIVPDSIEITILKDLVKDKIIEENDNNGE